MEIELPEQEINVECTGTLKTDFSLETVVNKSAAIQKIIAPIQPSVMAEFWRFRNPEKEFELLKVICESGRHKQTLVPFVNKLNRYQEVKVMKHTMVLLGQEAEELRDRYINASYIVDPYKGSSVDFIATQGPLPGTFNNFWRMVDHEKVKRVYMLCGLVERGHKKCDMYWPSTPKTSLVIQNEYEIALQEDQPEQDGFCTRRLISLNNITTGESRAIEQIQVECWPDHDIPAESELPGLFAFIDRAIKDYHDTPEVVHCSAGIGRTGTFIALFYLRRLYLAHKAQGNTQGFSIIGLVRNLKEQRFGLVTKSAQYKLLYQAVAYWISQDEQTNA